MERRFTAVFVRGEGDWWVAFVEELPNVVTQGKTLEEAREMVKDAIALILEDNRAELAHKLANDTEVIREEVTVEIPDSVNNCAGI